MDKPNPIISTAIDIAVVDMERFFSSYLGPKLQLLHTRGIDTDLREFGSERAERRVESRGSGQNDGEHGQTLLYLIPYYTIPLWDCQ